MRPGPKPPKEARADLLKEVAEGVVQRFKHSPREAIDYLLTHFSTFDLVQINQDLKRKSDVIRQIRN